MADQCCASKGDELERFARQADQRRVLITVLIINAAMFFFEFGAGIVAGSTALMVDATDMLGDALVCGVSIYALARGERWKAGAAMFKGALILLLGVGIVFNVIVKVQSGVPPSSGLMFAFGSLALVANLACLGLLWRFRSQDVNMASTFECSRNDVISNIGVLVAAGAVALLVSPWPDIIIGSAMAVLFLRSSLRVILQAVPHLRRQNNRT
jgi:Co/Zn/Cd efflux system component